MAENAEQQPYGRGRRAIEAQDRMRGEAGEEPTGSLPAEPGHGEPARGPERVERKVTQEQRMTRPPQVREHGLDEPRPFVDPGREQLGVGRPILAESASGLLDGAVQESDAAVVERVCELDGRLDSAQAETLQVEGPQERRSACEGVDRRADVVHEAWERRGQS